MKKLGWIVFASLMLLAVLVAMGLAGFLLFELPQRIGTVTVNGHPLDLHGAHAGHFLLATLGVLLVLVIALLAVPTAFVLMLAGPVVLAAFGLAVAALVVGVLLAPLFMLAWWLWKRSTKAGTIAA